MRSDGLTCQIAPLSAKLLLCSRQVSASGFSVIFYSIWKTVITKQQYKHEKKMCNRHAAVILENDFQTKSFCFLCTVKAVFALFLAHLCSVTRYLCIHPLFPLLADTKDRTCLLVYWFAQLVVFPCCSWLWTCLNSTALLATTCFINPRPGIPWRNAYCPLPFILLNYEKRQSCDHFEQTLTMKFSMNL